MLQAIRRYIRRGRNREGAQVSDGSTSDPSSLPPTGRTAPETKRLTGESLTLTDISRTTNVSLDTSEIYRRFAEQLRRDIAFDRLTINIVDHESGEFTYEVVKGLKIHGRVLGERFPVAGTVLEELVRTKKGSIIQSDNREDQVKRFPGLAVGFEAGLRSFLSVPIVSNDRVIGTILLSSRNSDAYSEADLDLAERFASQVAGILSGALPHAKLQKEAVEREVLADIGRMITSSLDIEEVYERFAEDVRQLIPCDWIDIASVDPAQKELRVEYTYGIPVAAVTAHLGYTRPLVGSILEEVLRRGTGILIVPRDRDELVQEFPAAVPGYDLGAVSEIVVPLVGGGKGIGMLAISTTRRQVYTEDDLRIAERVANQISGAVANARLLAERVRAAEALRESQGRFRSLFEDSAVGMALADRNGKLIQVNQAICRFLGYDESELTSKSVSDVTFQADREESRTLLRQLWVGEKDGFALEKRFLRKDGRLVWAAASVSAVRDGEGNTVYTLGQFQDITERKMLHEQLLQSQKMEAMGQLAGGVAHDFNNLLTVILGYASLVREDLPTGDRARDHLDQIQFAGQSAATITRQLLTFSRRQTSDPIVIGLNDSILSTSSMLQRLIGENIELVTLPAPGLGQVRIDPGQIEQVLVNMAVNARDAMPEGGKLTIETAGVTLDADSMQFVDLAPGRYVRLSVSDTGVGMSPDVQARVFEPFFTTKEVGKGTGLGLATCYGIVRQGGGDIRVESEPGIGTSFHIYLPITEGGGQGEAEGAPPATSATGTETILVTEDEDQVREIMVNALRGHGYHVLEASNGEEALRTAEEHDGAFHLLLTDIVLPRMGGRELAGKVLDRWPATVVLFTSGYDGEAPALETISLLQKPFALGNLLDEVRAALDGKGRAPAK